MWEDYLTVSASENEAIVEKLEKVWAPSKPVISEAMDNRVVISLYDVKLNHMENVEKAMKHICANYGIAEDDLR